MFECTIGIGFVEDSGSGATLYYRGTHHTSSWYKVSYTNVDEALYGLEDKRVFNAVERLSTAQIAEAVASAIEK